MKKYKIDYLVFEITQRCNYQCIHCCKGKSQNVDMTIEMVKNFFRDIYRVDAIEITGGEPLLNLEVFYAIIDMIIENNIKINEFNFTTNGSVLNEQVIFALKKLHDYSNEIKMQIRISTDMFHDSQKSQRAVTFYKDLVDKNNLQDIIHFNKYNMSDLFGVYSKTVFFYCGNTISNKDEIISKLNGREYFFDYEYTECCYVNTDGNELDSLVLLPSGDVSLIVETSYLKEKIYSMGNILDNSLEEIIEKNNRTSVYTDKERQKIKQIYSNIVNLICADDKVFKQKLNMSTNLRNSRVCESILSLDKYYYAKKQRGKLLSNGLKFADVIKQVPIYSDMGWNIFIENCKNCMNPMSRDRIFSNLKNQYKYWNEETLNILADTLCIQEYLCKEDYIDECDRKKIEDCLRECSVNSIY